jgi:hypothetical protein
MRDKRRFDEVDWARATMAICYILVAISITTLLLQSSASGQQFADSVKWRIYLMGVDSENSTTIPMVGIGLHPDAHNPIPPTDTMHDFTDRWFENFRLANDTEWAQQPPIPPGSSWLLSNLRQPFVGQFKVMYHQFIDSTMNDTTVVRWTSDAIGNVDPVNQTWWWPPPSVLKYYADSIVLTDVVGSRLRINLTKDSLYNYNVAKDTIPGLIGIPISTNNLRLIIFHPKRPPLPPDSVATIYPFNGAANIMSKDTLQWQSVPTLPGMAVYYRVQISTDRTFKSSSIVLQDSITGTNRTFALPLVQWYYWRVKAFAPFGVGIYKTSPDSFYVSTIVSAVGNDKNHLPSKFTLHQNYPNPFNPTTVITYDVPVRTGVRIQIFNMLGQVIRILVNKVQEPGTHIVNLDAGNMPSGIYYYRITAGAYTETKKMLLLR